MTEAATADALTLDIRFDLTYADVLRGSKRIIRRQSTTVLLVVGTALTIPAMLMLWLLSANFTVPLRPLVPVMAWGELLILGVGLYAWFGAPVQSARHSQRMGLLGEWVVTAAPSEFAYRTPVSSVTSRWGVLHAVESDKHGLYIYTRPNAAIIVPRHAFEDEDSLLRARQWLRFYLDAARDGAQATDVGPHT